jgi:hypothetical protein
LVVNFFMFSPTATTTRFRLRQAFTMSRAAHSIDEESNAIVTTLNSNDILLGRGAPNAYYEGNVRFRRLVQTRREEYLSTARHPQKQEIAREIFNQVAEGQGRFLMEIKPARETKALGVPAGKKAWRVADKSIALEKIKQTLRERNLLEETADLPKHPHAHSSNEIANEIGGSPSGVAHTGTDVPTLFPTQNSGADTTTLQGHQGVLLSHAPNAIMHQMGSMSTSASAMREPVGASSELLAMLQLQHQGQGMDPQLQTTQSALNVVLQIQAQNALILEQQRIELLRLQLLQARAVNARSMPFAMPVGQGRALTFSQPNGVQANLPEVQADGRTANATNTIQESNSNELTPKRKRSNRNPLPH